MDKNVKVSYTLSEQQIIELMNLYKEEIWCKNRKLNDVRKMLENSWTIALLHSENGGIIAFARVLSDFVYRAFI